MPTRRLPRGVSVHYHSHREGKEKNRRWWFRFYRGKEEYGPDYQDIRQVSFELAWGKRARTLGWRVTRNSNFADENGGLNLAFHIPFLSFYTGITKVFKDTHKDPEREWGFAIHGDLETMGSMGSIELNWNSQETPYGDRKGFFKWIDIADKLFGNTEYFKIGTGLPETFYVEMPEGVYAMRVTGEKAIWIRPRWPFPIKRSSWEVDAGRDTERWPGQYGIAIPHKRGGDDALVATGFGMDKYPTAEDAAKAFIGKVVRDRERYGDGRNWRPDKSPVLQTPENKPLLKPVWTEIAEGLSHAIE